MLCLFDGSDGSCGVRKPPERPPNNVYRPIEEGNGPKASGICSHNYGKFKWVNYSIGLIINIHQR